MIVVSLCSVSVSLATSHVRVNAAGAGGERAVCGASDTSGRGRRERAGGGEGGD